MVSGTTELDKQHAVISSGEAGHVQDFLDWLMDECGWHLADYDMHGRSQSVMKSRPEIMADYFGIDLDKIEEERQSLLSHIRNENLGREGS